MILFHAAVLSFPVLAFMWTFYGFSLFTIIFGVEIKFLHTFGFALFHFVFLVIGLACFILAIADDSSRPYSSIVLLALIPLAIAYIAFIIKMIKYIFQNYEQRSIESLKRNESVLIMND